MKKNQHECNIKTCEDYCPHYCGDCKPNPDDENSARLCNIHAAAPELLVALETLLSTVSDKEIDEHDDIGEQGHDAETCALCMAREAITKATGKDGN